MPQVSELLQCRYLTSSTSSSVKNTFNYGKHREVAYVQVLNDVGYDPLRWLYVITDDTTVDLPYSKPLLVLRFSRILPRSLHGWHLQYLFLAIKHVIACSPLSIPRERGCSYEYRSVFYTSRVHSMLALPFDRFRLSI